MNRAILWDMDGTLIDSEPAHGAAFDDAVAELGLAVPPGLHGQFLGASLQDLHSALVDQTGLDMSYADWAALKWRHYQRHAASVHLRAPVADLAIDLAARGVPMALVSNSTADEVRLNMAATGLGRILPLQISRADVMHGKPAPDGYLLAAQRLGIAPADCLVVEDSLTGARAGIAAGMSVLFYPQFPLSKDQALPKGITYLAPDQDPRQIVNDFLAQATLPNEMTS